MAGKKLRLGRIFREDGRALVLAMDHCMGMGPVPGLTKPAETIAKVKAGGVDAVLTTTGIASTFDESFHDLGLILRLDGAFTILTGGLDRMDIVYTAETALRIGADAVACMGFVGGSEERRTLKYLGGLAQECEKWQIPLLAEMLVMEGEGEEVTPERVALAARTGVENGADFIKTTFAGDETSFSQVIEGCYKPVLVLGGSKQKDIDLLKVIASALSAGAAGAVIGRNIWQHEKPEAMARALCSVVHDGLSPDEAYASAGLSV
jgi:DhnA family fructose-bisphosphate aldolase class Ia